MAVKEFYTAALSHLFAKDPHPMIQPYVKDTIYLERNDPKARDAEGIGRGYSVDAANSSWAKFNLLSTVLTAYDFEEASLSFGRAPILSSKCRVAER